MHVHVVSPDGEAKFWLEPHIELVMSKGLGTVELNELKRVIEEVRMKSESIVSDTLAVEVLNISRHGFWLWVRGREYFLDFDLFPWFRRATVEQLCAVELLHEEHLYWPQLDVDLDVDRILHPEKYPLVAGTGN